MHGEWCELDSFLTWTLLSVNVLTCFLSPSQTVHLAMLFFFLHFPERRRLRGRRDK